MNISFFCNANEDLDLTVASGNSFNMMDLLQIKCGYCGSIAAEHLLQSIAAARQDMTVRGCEFTRPASLFMRLPGPTVIDCELDSEQITFYLDRLELIARAAKVSGKAQVNWG